MREDPCEGSARGMGRLVGRELMSCDLLDTELSRDTEQMKVDREFGSCSVEPSAFVLGNFVEMDKVLDLELLLLCGLGLDIATERLRFGLDEK